MANVYDMNFNLLSDPQATLYIKMSGKSNDRNKLMAENDIRGHEMPI